MKYSDVVRFKYPDHILTYIGTGLDYNALQWSEFNSAPNPIPKETLDSDIAYYIANNQTIPIGELSTADVMEVLAIGSLPETGGFLKKITHGIYSLDNSTYLTSINSSLVTTALGYTPYDASNPNFYTTKTYVDNLLYSGAVWIDPVITFSFIGTSTSPIANPVTNDIYI